jgi:methionyl-tRNA formyltransferase
MTHLSDGGHVLVRIVLLGSPEEVLAPFCHVYQESVRNNSLSLHVIAVVSQPARPVGRHKDLIDPPVAAWAKSVGILCLQPESARDPLFLEQLRALKPDLMITAAYGQILNQEFLDIPTRGTINIHPSKLPRHRGATPVPQTLLHGDKIAAVSVLFTVKKLDAGPIIVAKEYPVLPDETAGALTLRLFQLSSELVMEAIDRLKDPLFTGEPQNDDQATFCKKIEKEDGKVNWSLDAVTIVNRFRAFEPWPGSWSLLRGQRIVLSQLKIFQDGSSARPGSFHFNKAERTLVVEAAKGLVSVGIVKPAGSKAMDAASFWNGIKDKDNIQFES